MRNYNKKIDSKYGNSEDFVGGWACRRAGTQFVAGVEVLFSSNNWRDKLVTHRKQSQLVTTNLSSSNSELLEIERKC